MNELTTRILSALVLGPLVLGLVMAGGKPFLLLLAVVGILALEEAMRIPDPASARLAWLGGSLSWLAVLAGCLGPGGFPAALAITAAGGVAMGLALARRPAAMVRSLGFVYISLCCLALLWLRQSGPEGLGLFLFLLLSVWATDIGAYAAGRTFGGPKLAPRISPNKTWAGLLGGMAAAAVVGAAVLEVAGWWGMTIPADLTGSGPGRGMAAAAILAAVSQGGDLLESGFKRHYGVKDSGRIIPGHGGLLDRIDGLLAAAPVLAGLRIVFGG